MIYDNFSSYSDWCWDRHPDHSEEVFETFSTSFNLVENTDQVEQFAHLITHVCGEHLQRWNEGISLLLKLKELKHDLISVPSTCNDAISRFVAVLRLGSNEISKDEFLASDFTNVDKIRVLCIASSALTLCDVKRSSDLFRTTLNLANSCDFERTSPANRALAVAGNNLAYTIEESTLELDSDYKDLMLEAAAVGRKYWEIAGTSKEVGRAEHRLAMCYIRVKLFEQATIHANNALKIVTEDNGLPMDFFNSYACLAIISKSTQQQDEYSKYYDQAMEYYNKMLPQVQIWSKYLLEMLQN